MLANLAKVGVLFIIGFIITGCASSNVSRTTTANVDSATTSAKGVFEGSDIDVAESYQNTSQTTKGALVGGAVGGMTGAMASKIGVFPGLGIGALLGATYGAYIDANTTLEDKLINRGANIVALGDQILIVLPSAHIFQTASADIKPQAYSTLRMVAGYINSYTKMLVKVSAYTDPLGPSDVNLALSQRQAEQIAKYLLASGIDARLLYAAGYGGTDVVDRVGKDWGSSDNYRVEITLEKLYF